MKYLKLYENDIFDDYDQDFEEEDWTQLKNKIEIDDIIYTVDDMYEDGYLYYLEINNKEHSQSAIVAPSREYAGRVARKQYEDLDKEELIEIIGKDNLVSWAFGELVSIGNELVSSLDEWLDIFSNNPEEAHSGDGEERTVTNCSGDIINRMKETPKVAYFQ